jgi:hypothetical protein
MKSLSSQQPRAKPLRAMWQSLSSMRPRAKPLARSFSSETTVKEEPETAPTGSACRSAAPPAWPSTSIAWQQPAAAERTALASYTSELINEVKASHVAGPVIVGVDTEFPTRLSHAQMRHYSCLHNEFAREHALGRNGERGGGVGVEQAFAELIHNTSGTGTRDDHGGFALMSSDHLSATDDLC